MLLDCLFPLCFVSVLAASSDAFYFVEGPQTRSILCGLVLVGPHCRAEPERDMRDLQRDSAAGSAFQASLEGFQPNVLRLSTYLQKASRIAWAGQSKCMSEEEPTVRGGLVQAATYSIP